MSVLKIRNKNNEWTSIPAIKGDKGDQGVGIQEIKIVNSKLIIKYDNNKEQIIDNLTQIGTISQVDETYSDTSENPQSGKAVAQAIEQFNDKVSTNINNLVKDCIKNELSPTNTNSELNKALTSIKNNIKTNTDNIKTNTDNIAINASKIKKNTNKIAINASNITTNTDNIAINATKITTNASKIAINTNKILAIENDTALSLSNETVLSDKYPNCTTLNDVKYPGVYAVRLGDNEIPLENRPTNLGFKLIVIHGYIHNGTSSRYHLFALVGNNNSIYYRTYANSQWNNWITFNNPEYHHVEVDIPTGSSVCSAGRLHYIKMSDDTIDASITVSVRYAEKTLTTPVIQLPSDIFENQSYSVYMDIMPCTNAYLIMKNLKYSMSASTKRGLSLTQDSNYQLQFHVYYDGTFGDDTQTTTFKLNLRLIKSS